MADELITIAKFHNLGEARLAQGKLNSAGIAARVRDENMINLHMGIAIGGIRLQVPDSQVVRALEVLDDFIPEARRRKTKARPTPSPAARSASRWRFARSAPTARGRLRCGRRPFRFPIFSRASCCIAGSAWPADISGKRRKSERELNQIQ